MNRDDFRKIVNDSVAQSLAQGSHVPPMPPDQLLAMVNGIADGVFVGLEATLDDDGVPNAVDLRQPGVADATGKAAAAAAAAATQAILTGKVPSIASIAPIAPIVTQVTTNPAPPANPIPVATSTVVSPRLTSNTSANVKPPVPPQSQTAAAEAAVGGSMGEILLWRGRPYMMIGINYELTTQRLRIIRGIAGQTIEEVELVRVRDTSVRQSMMERLFDIGDIEIISTDARQPTKLLFNVKDPIEVRELVRKAVVDERARRGVYYREEMRGDEEMHDMTGEPNSL